jgi:hypothetical protein
MKSWLLLVLMLSQALTVRAEDAPALDAAPAVPAAAAATDAAPAVPAAAAAADAAPAVPAAAAAADAAPAVPAAAAAPASEGDLTQVIEEALALRDPFKRPEGFQVNAAVTISELERFPTEQYKLVGVITGASRLRAILQDPEGKTHFVAERMRIGTRRGVIRQIRTDAVVVRERMVNVLGKEETSDNEIRLPDENRKSEGSSG